MNKGKNYILPDNVEIKEIKQTMYSNGDGFAYGDELAAEYAVAIGTTCDCGKFISGKYYTACTDCRIKRHQERYEKMPLVEWDEETPLTIFGGDKFFYYEEDIDLYCEENDIERSDLALVLCKANEAPYFELNDYCCDILPEDIEIYDLENKDCKYSAKEVENIVNDFLSSIKPISWGEGKKRVSLK